MRDISNHHRSPTEVTNNKRRIFNVSADLIILRLPVRSELLPPIVLNIMMLLLEISANVFFMSLYWQASPSITCAPICVSRVLYFALLIKAMT